MKTFRIFQFTHSIRLDYTSSFISYTTYIFCYLFNTLNSLSLALPSVISFVKSTRRQYMSNHSVPSFSNVVPYSAFFHVYLSFYPTNLHQPYVTPYFKCSYLYFSSLTMFHNHTRHHFIHMHSGSGS